MEGAVTSVIGIFASAIWIKISSVIINSSKEDEEKKWRKEVVEKELTKIVNILQAKEDAMLKSAMLHVFSDNRELTVTAYNDAIKYLINEENPYEKRIIGASIAVTICRRMNRALAEEEKKVQTKVKFGGKVQTKVKFGGKFDEKVPLDVLFDLKKLQTDIKHVNKKAPWMSWGSKQTARLRRVFLALRMVYNNKEYKHDLGNSLGLDGEEIVVCKHLRKIIIEKVKELREKKYKFDKIGKFILDTVDGLDDEISREFWLWWNQDFLHLDPTRHFSKDDMQCIASMEEMQDLYKVCISTDSLESSQCLAYTGCIYCGAMYNGMLIVPVYSNILLYNLKAKVAVVFYEHRTVKYFHHCGMVLDGDRLLLVGGGKKRHFKNNAGYGCSYREVTVYNIKEKKLSRIPGMTHGRCNPAVLLHENCLYACGGDFSRDLIVEFYNFSSGKWNCTKPMSHRKQNPFMVLYKSKLFVFGSRKISLELEKLANTPPLEWYDFERKEWKSTASRTTLIKGVMKGVSTKRRDRYMDFQFGTNDTDHFISAAALKDKILLLTTVNPK
eukprot:CAMPEP_0167742142 /NCGR_PEP_ID=MMETSP0110_2-20121227/1260_1 /TAXON_ID=629695 /ORGANISM="Gymnochlora sp., Strain CCMP2014" /LENGTH=554 /DNA_ID=CAMNT_0007626297 /DNA_START=8 /DNA_END=1669 /DNA_ORIENTATION=-